MWALERGVTLALANKESLVAAGELALRAQERGGGLLLPVDSEHSALFQCRATRRGRESLVVTASGGPFRGRTRDELRDVTPAEALAHPTWSMGTKITIDSATLANKGLEVIEAHFLFGLRYDRIEVVVHPTSIVHGARPLPRRRRDRASRLPGHARPDLVRAHLSRARRDAGAAARPRGRADARVLRAGPRDVPAARARARRRRAWRDLSMRVQRRERGGGRARSSTGGSASSTSLRSSRTRSARVDGSPARDLDELREADRRARELVRSAAWAVTVVAIVGLAVLVMIHEAGHFFAARAVGMTPRKFYLGFGPRSPDDARRRRVRHRLDPARRLREDPGNEPPVAGRPAQVLAARTTRERHAADCGPSTPRSSAGTTTAARAKLLELEAASSANRALAGARGRARAGRLLAAATWRRLTAIFAGPRSTSCSRSCSSRCSSSSRRRGRRTSSGRCRPARRRPPHSCKASDPSRRRRRARAPKNIPAHIRATQGRPVKLLVQPERRAHRDRAAPGAARCTAPTGSASRSRRAPARASRRRTAVARRAGADLVSHGRDRALARPPRDRRGTRTTCRARSGSSRSAGAWRAGAARLPRSCSGLISLALGLLNLLPVLPLDGGHIVMALRREGARPHLPPGGLHAVHRRRAVALPAADVLRPPKRPLRRRWLSRPRFPS